MAQKLNSAGVAHAAGLIRQGKVKNSTSWSGPSPEKEDEYIKSHGYAAWSKWYLAENPSENKGTKARYGYPFSNDFENVDEKGLKAVHVRSAQQGLKSVYDAATRLLNKIEKKTATASKHEAKLAEAWNGIHRGLDVLDFTDSPDQTKREEKQKNNTEAVKNVVHHLKDYVDTSHAYAKAHVNDELEDLTLDDELQEEHDMHPELKDDGDNGIDQSYPSFAKKHGPHGAEIIEVTYRGVKKDQSF